MLNQLYSMQTNTRGDNYVSNLWQLREPSPSCTASVFPHFTVVKITMPDNCFSRGTTRNYRTPFFCEESQQSDLRIFTLLFVYAKLLYTTASQKVYSVRRSHHLLNSSQFSLTVFRCRQISINRKFWRDGLTSLGRIGAPLAHTAQVPVSADVPPTLIELCYHCYHWLTLTPARNRCHAAECAVLHATLPQ